MKIRTMRRRDVRPCRKIIESHYTKKYGRVAQIEMLNALADAEHRFLVAEDHGEVVGLTALFQAPVDFDVMELFWVAVARDRQSEGIGTRLVKEALRVARSKHTTLVILTARIPKFYERFGFKGYHQFGANKWIMGLQL